MKIGNKEYQVKAAEDVTVFEGKLLINTATAYGAFIDSERTGEAEKYALLKDLWRDLAGRVVLEADETVIDLDKIPARHVKDFLDSFFPKSSETKT